jgi:hypothetical protein
MNRPPPVTFVGFVSEAGGKLVQDWFDALSIEDRDEIRDTVNYLVATPITEWKRPEVDKVNHPLVEIRCKGQAGNAIRIYGAFSQDVRARFVILNATTNKKKSHDKEAQELAKKRLKSIKSGKASIHEFSFEERSDRQS